MKRVALLSSIIACMAAAATGQTAAGPFLGWNLKPDARSLHAVLGIPGSLRSGGEIPLPRDIRLLALSPSSSLAVSVEEDAGSPVLYDVASGVRTSLEGAAASPANAGWSPSGAAFGLLYADRRSVQVFASRNGRYQLAGEFPTEAVRFAVADDGTAILSLTNTELLLQGGRGALHIADAPITAFAFLAGTVTPALLNAGALRIGEASIDIGLRSDEPAYLTSPQPDRLVVAQRTGNITVFSVSGEIVARMSCNCRIGGLASLGQPGRLALNVDSTTTLWVLDAASPPQLYFVPPSHEGNEAR